MLRSSHNVSLASIEKLAGTLQLLSDDVRLKIMFHLMDGERNVSFFCNELNIAQPTASHHLGLLRRANIILARRAGKQIFYSIARTNGAPGPKFTLKTNHWSIVINNNASCQ